MLEGEVPIHRSLTEELLIGGLPRSVALLFWVITTALTFALQSPWLIGFGIVAHLLLIPIVKKDHHIMTIFLQQFKETGRLEP